MDVFETIRRRRSIRSYEPKEIPEDIVAKLLEAVRLAPSSGNRQPYRFIVVREKATREALAAACRWNPGRAKGHEYIADAPLVIAACGYENESITRYYKDGVTYLTTNRMLAQIDKDPHKPYLSMMMLDIAVAFDHLDLAATSLGLGTCWVASIDELEVKKVLGVPDEVRVLAVMTIGYTSTWPEPRPRKDFSGLICREKWMG